MQASLHCIKFCVPFCMKIFKPIFDPLDPPFFEKVEVCAENMQNFMLYKIGYSKSAGKARAPSPKWRDFCSILQKADLNVRGTNSALSLIESLGLYFFRLSSVGGALLEGGSNNSNFSPKLQSYLIVYMQKNCSRVQNKLIYV